MVVNVKKEVELYEPMRNWLQQYLECKFPAASIQSIDAHARALDYYLEKAGIDSEYPQAIGLDIQIDILGLVKQRHRTDLYFIEAKKTELTLRDLGQLWAYCKLCDPKEAFLLSSLGLGSLNKILKNLSREDLLEFGDGRLIKKMRVAKWDISRSSLDYNTIVPRIN